MSSNVILKVENLSKQYRLGLVGTGTLSHDLNRWWSNILGKEDPYLKIGEVNNQSVKAKSNYVWALKAINFEVKQGEVLGIVGKNGAGKSTLLKILSRVTSPTTGVVKTKGRIASLLEVGTGFHPEMTGRENIYLNGAILGMTKSEITSKLDEIVDFSGCARYIDTPVKRYSSGMRVRLAFAVAAHLEPDILVVDEVLAVGDAEFQKKAIGKMQDISKGEGRTVLFVSHNMTAVKNLCTRAMLLSNGGISFKGSTADVINHYISVDNGRVANQVNIVNAENRIGNGLAKITDLSILNNSILTGEDLSIKINYENLSQFKIVEFGISIWKLDETKIISLSSTFKNQLNNINQKEGSVFCEINSLPLVKGSYLMNVFVGLENGLADYVEKAIVFSVEENDFYGSGKTVNPEWGVVVVNHNWEVL